MEGGVHEQRNAGWPLEQENAGGPLEQEQILLESLKRNRALLTTAFSPVRPKSDFCSLGL